ncbi:MAG: Ig-like domain-containing protein [Saprospiraceae bacterium]|nr:Ig-like domain-containing protein [Saprospiraceae bacterium]
MNTISRKLELLSYGVLLSFLIGCASTGSPSGGPRDRTPPGLVVEKSSPNFSTNFTPEKVDLVFDEWIELKNQKREILISPPFFRNPKITSRGKKVTVEFPEEEPLREDATYTINFGKSIVDFTEGNAAEGFRFVFATGDVIDSLEFSGGIVDAIKGEPVKDILVLLYDLVGDSVVVQEKPFYYARTDDAGQFKFQNLKNDTFKLLVLEDLNFNYVLDPELEQLAFPDSLFILNDSASYNPQLRLFKPEQSLRILNSSSQKAGLITTQFNKEAENVSFSFLYPGDFEPLVERSNDTLFFWYTELLDTVGVIYDLDTLDFTLKPFDSTFYDQKVTLHTFNAAKTILAPFDSLQLSFSAPIASIDTSLIKLSNIPAKAIIKNENDTLSILFDSTKNVLVLDSNEVQLDTLNQDSIVVEQDSVSFPLDSLPTLIETSGVLPDSIVLEDLDVFKDSLNIDSIGVLQDSLVLDSMANVLDTVLVEYDFTSSFGLRQLFVHSNWKEKFEYRLELMPGAITDIYGRQNDTLSIEFKTAGLDEFGNIAINLSGLDSAQQYVILLKLNNDVIRKTIIGDSIPPKIDYRRLRVNTYSIEIIKDDDQNGEWTTGDYWLKRQPEELKTITLEKLRENWDLEANVFWNEEETNAVDSTGSVQDSTLLDQLQQGLNNPPDRPKPKGTKGSPKIVPDPKGKND